MSCDPQPHAQFDVFNGWAGVTLRIEAAIGQEQFASDRATPTQKVLMGPSIALMYISVKQIFILRQKVWRCWRLVVAPMTASSV